MLVRGGGGGVFKLGNDGKINEFNKIIGSKREGKKNVLQQTQLELKKKRQNGTDGGEEGRESTTTAAK